MLDLKPEYVEMALQIARTYVPTRRIIAFGSRVSGKARRFSDSDLAADGDEPIGCRAVRRLKEAFSISDLPAADEAFRSRVLDSRGTDLPTTQTRLTRCVLSDLSTVAQRRGPSPCVSNKARYHDTRRSERL